MALLYLAVIFALLPLTFVPVTGRCDATLPSDLVFLVDESGSVNETNFALQMEFIAHFISGFKGGPTGARVGLVTYSTDVVAEYYLNTYTSIRRIQIATRHVQYNHSGLTFTNLGLDFVRKTMFTPMRGDRPNAKNVILVLTDGESTIKMATLVAANEVHQENFTVFAIGITGAVNLKELRAIASDNKHVLTVKDFSDLNGIVGTLEKSTCNEVKNQPTTLSPTTTTSKTTTTTTTPKPTTTTTTPKPTTTTTTPKPTTTTTPKPTTTTTTPKPTTTTTTPKPTTTTTTPKPTTTTTTSKPTTTTTPKPTKTTTTPKPTTTTTPKPTTTTTTPKPTSTPKPRTTTTKPTATSTQIPTTTSSTPPTTTIKQTTVTKTTKKQTRKISSPKSTRTTTSKPILIQASKASIHKTIYLPTNKNTNATYNQTDSEELYFPGWFSYLEIGVISVISVLALGGVTCCCQKVCCAGLMRRRKGDDDDDDEDAEGEWKKSFRGPIKRPTIVSINEM